MTATFSIHLDLIVVTDSTEEAFDEHTDAILDRLMDADTVFDADMSVSLAEHLVNFSVGVEADDPSQAMGVAFAAIRSAIHAEGAATPGWEDALTRARADISPVTELAGV